MLRLSLRTSSHPDFTNCSRTLRLTGVGALLTKARVARSEKSYAGPVLLHAPTFGRWACRAAWCSARTTPGEAHQAVRDATGDRYLVDCGQGRINGHCIAVTGERTPVSLVLLQRFAPGGGGPCRRRDTPSGPPSTRCSSTWPDGTRHRTCHTPA